MKLSPAPTYRDEPAEYFRWARQVLHTYSFDSQRDYAVWELHADGCSFADITEMVGLSKTLAFRIIKGIKTELTYSGNQGNQGKVTPSRRVQCRRLEATVSRTLDEMLELLAGAVIRTKRRSSLVRSSP